MPRKSPYEFTPDDWTILKTQCGLLITEYNSFPSGDQKKIKEAYKKFIDLLATDEIGDAYFGSRTFLQNIVNEIRCKIREQAE